MWRGRALKNGFNLTRHFHPDELVPVRDFARRSGDPLLFQVVGLSEPG